MICASLYLAAIVTFGQFEKREHILDYDIGTTSDAVSIPCTLYINLDFLCLVAFEGRVFLLFVLTKFRLPYS